MSNSSLISCAAISPNKSHPRREAIERITIHCTAVQCTAERIGDIFKPTSRQASCNYGIGKDGRIVLVVDEADRSWCSSNADNDHRAVTIEVSSDSTAPYAVTDAALNAAIDLCTDICRRNGKRKLLWFGDRAKTLNYTQAPDEMVMTVHRWFAAKACPGDYLYNRHGMIAEEVTRRLNPAGTTKQEQTAKEMAKMTDAEFDELMTRWLANRGKLPPSAPWVETGIVNARELGLSDGSRPMAPATRAEVMVMCNAAVRAAKNG